MAVKYNGIEKYIWSDTYNFFLKHHNDSNTDESWNELLEDARQLTIKYHDHPLLRKILAQTIMQIESKVGGRYIEGKSYRQWEYELGHVIKHQ
ncbi:MAG: hypothetical protein J6A59_11325 [Lachnospiraceae bacterium]|nr:hypothetical protein [Lachnospiraceae bacterium]